MTRSRSTAAADPDARRAPAEGWGSLLLLLVMLAVVALAVDNSRWVGVGANGQSQTGFLVWAILLGGLWGFVTAKSNLPALAAHLAGAGLAALFIIVSVAGVVSRADELSDRIRALMLSLTGSTSTSS